jgi:tetratricopeptide (TPR) repeat protein
MNMNKNIALITSILLFQSTNFAITLTSKAQTVPQNSNCEIIPEKDALAGKFSEKQLETIASRITVKVIGDNNGGSGTLLAKKGNTYLVLTNNHVVRGVNSIKIKTVDGKTHTAQIVPNTKFEKFDLALLQFQSNEIYCPRDIEDVANFIPNTTTSVTAGGFSGEKGEMIFSHGKIQQISQPLKEGYQIGYTSNIEQGMSGGAIIDSSGILVGINGRGAYPILNSAYVYENGSRPSEAEIQEMRKLSWGIPISTVLAEVNADILTAYSLPLPETTASVPEPQLTGWLGDLEQKAKEFTVRIDSTSTDNGSGVIIAKNKDGNTYTYTVLTAAHVVCERNKGDDITKPCRDENYKIVTHDNEKYPVDKSTIKKEEGIDLAVVKFKSERDYQVATLANYNPNSYQYILTAGYPKLKANYSPWKLTIGRTFDKELGLIKSGQSDFTIYSNGKLRNTTFLSGGYELVYTNITSAGMSGGAVLDFRGEVIGIHGRAEAEEGKLQVGYSLGIPISTFLEIEKQFHVQANVKNSYVPQLSYEQIKDIEKAVLSTNVTTGNATAKQWIERGNQFWRLRRYSDAIKAFDEAIRQNTSSSYLAYYGKGLALGEYGKYQEALEALEQAVKLKNNFADVWRRLSKFHRELNQFEEALLAIEKAIQLQPQNRQKNPNLYNEKFSVLTSLKRYKEAEVAINQAIDINPRGAFYLNRGNLYSVLQKRELALADFNKAIAINPQDIEAYVSRGILYDKQKKSELALADFNKAIAINPESVRAYIIRGSFYFEQKKSELALADYNKVIAIDPDYTEAYIVRGYLYQKQKKRELALADFNKAIAITINPYHAKAYTRRGQFYYEQKKFELALADYNKAIAINSDYAEALYSRGDIYAEQKKSELALADYNKD